jgi:hypothetical protein
MTVMKIRKSADQESTKGKERLPEEQEKLPGCIGLSVGIPFIPSIPEHPITIKIGGGGRI